MKIFDIYRKEHPDYDEYGGFVVRAKNEEEAFEMCRRETGHDISRELFDIEELTIEGDSGIIIEDFREG